MYIAFNAPIRAGGQPEPFTPPLMPLALSFDAGGNPLPLQVNPSASPVPANQWTAAATSAGGGDSLVSSGLSLAPLAGMVSGYAASAPSIGAPSGASGGVPVVLPWLDYGGGAAGGSQAAPWQGSQQPGSGWGIFGAAFGGSQGEPPWSDAVAGGSCCGGSRSLWDLIKAHPWLTLGIGVTLMRMINGSRS